MPSTLITAALVVFFCALAGASAWEGNWPKVLYWMGAMATSLGVLWMK